MRSMRLKSARPRLGFLEGCAVRLTLMMIAPSGGDDTTNELADIDPVCVHEGEERIVGNPDRHDTHLTILLAVVDPFDRRPIEDPAGELEVEPPGGQRRFTLL